MQDYEVVDAVREGDSVASNRIRNNNKKERWNDTPSEHEEIAACQSHITQKQGWSCKTPFHGTVCLCIPHHPSTLSR